MRPFRRVGLVAASFSAIALLSIVAEAQDKPALPPVADRSNSQFTLRREQGGGAAGQAARSRARAGDCAGALPDFDVAIQSSIDPTLRRDRGLCHDKLGHPFPAIDDYRAYLAARPDAPDAEQIRQRLTALEPNEASSESAAETPPDQEASAALSVGSRGVFESEGSSGSSHHAVIGPKPGEKAHPYDYYVQREKENAVIRASPLRYGKGIVLGPFLNIPRFFFGDGARSDVGYAAGGTLRYSTGRVLTLVSEIGFSGIGKTGDASSQSGPLFMGGVELRLSVSKEATDHVLLRGGIGYERNVVSGTRAFQDDLLGRFAVGYRHVFGTAVGLEGLIDGGPLIDFPEAGSARVNFLLGFSLAFVVGF